MSRLYYHQDVEAVYQRALRRDADGEIDESLIPKEIRQWYEDSEDEQQTSSDSESDCGD